MIQIWLLSSSYRRNTVWNTVYFGTMHKLKERLPTPSSKAQDLLQTLLSGFIGAVFATCFNAPFDVVKSRFQSQLPAQTGGFYVINADVFTWDFSLFLKIFKTIVHVKLKIVESSGAWNIQTNYSFLKFFNTSYFHLTGCPPRYTSTFQTLSLIYKEEGLSACYKGFAPKAIRMGLGGAVAMSTFEFVQYAAT